MSVQPSVSLLGLPHIKFKLLLDGYFFDIIIKYSD